MKFYQTIKRFGAMIPTYKMEGILQFAYGTSRSWGARVDKQFSARCFCGFAGRRLFGEYGLKYLT